MDIPTAVNRGIKCLTRPKWSKGHIHIDATGKEILIYGHGNEDSQRCKQMKWRESPQEYIFKKRGKRNELQTGYLKYDCKCTKGFYKKIGKQPKKSYK